MKNPIKILLKLNQEQSKNSLFFLSLDIIHIEDFVYFRSFSLSKRILTPDLFAILTSLKIKGLFYKKVRKDKDDEDYNIKSKPRSGLISN